MAEAIAPPTEDRVPTAGGVGIKTQPNLGWETPAPLQIQNAEADKKYSLEFAPKVATVFKAAQPNATPQDHIAAADALKAFSGPKKNEDFAGSHDTRWEDVFSAPTIGAAITAFTGGSDRREIGRNGEGLPVVTVYNARGDVRRYEWMNGERIKPEELQALGPVTSVRDISAERASTYKARGLSAEQVAAAQSRAWQRDLNAADLFAREASTAVDVNNQIKKLSKELVPYSANPATRTILSRIGTLTANKEQQSSIARQQLERFAKGEATLDEFNDFKRDNVGIMGTFNYNQGQGLTTGNNQKVTSENINELTNKIASTNSSAEKIQSNAQNLANWAQMIATENKLPVIDKIQELVGLKAQAALIEKKIEEAGGVPGFKGSPNVAHNVTDSFSLAYANAEYGAAQAEAAKAYAELVLGKKQQLGFKTPDIGVISAEFANSNLAKTLRQQRTKGIESFRSEIGPVLDKLSQEPAYKEVSAQVAGVPVKPPALPEMPTKSEIPGAKAPKQKTKEKSPYGDVLNSLFPK